MQLYVSSASLVISNLLSNRGKVSLISSRLIRLYVAVHRCVVQPRLPYFVHVRGVFRGILASDALQSPVPLATAGFKLTEDQRQHRRSHRHDSLIVRIEDL